MFIGAQRDAIWDLHVYPFGRMLPYFHRYDHANYARWGAILYLAQMNYLPVEVLRQFQLGNWVVKESDGIYVDPDQSQGWLNGKGDRGGGIVGFTKKHP